MMTIGTPPTGAGMTPLPPSPETKPLQAELDLSPFSLNGTTTTANGNSNKTRSPSRLKSIARYEAFSPQALACSDPLPTTSFASGTNINNNSNTTSSSNNTLSSLRNTQQQRQRFVAPRGGAVSSLGAVAGALGVAVFRVSKPHEPLLMLNHSTALHPRSVSALAFQPDTTSSLYLAAARGSGVLVWDVSGHSLSPLLGRLSMEHLASAPYPATAANVDAYRTTSLSWKLSPHGEEAGVPILATTTPYAACLWDLRGSFAKPSLRFAVIHTSKKSDTATPSPYVQMACSRSHECATMDAAGTVRVFDLRMASSSSRGSSSTNSLSSFSAFAHTGVGISYMPLYNMNRNSPKGESKTAWVTWGMDDIDNTGGHHHKIHNSPSSTRIPGKAIVKVWSAFDPFMDRPATDPGNKTGGDDYWYLDGSADRGNGSLLRYRLVAHCRTPYRLACPRVCPEPVENSIVTIGIEDASAASRQAPGSWRADLWKIRPADQVEDSADAQQPGAPFAIMERVVTFHGGTHHDKYIQSTLGDETGVGSMQAAELAITSYHEPQRTIQDENVHNTTTESGIGETDEVLGLTLCCLSNKGFVTTHIVPEAIPKIVQPQIDAIGTLSPTRSGLGTTGRARVFPEDKESAVVDAANVWGTQDRQLYRMFSGTDGRGGGSPTKEKSAFIAPEAQPLPSRPADGGMLFDMDVPAVAYSTVTNESLAGVQIGAMDLSSPKAAAASLPGVEEDNATADVRDMAAIVARMDNIETERIPCPRLCGATFGSGIGGLAVFNNGDIRKLWLWYKRAGSGSNSTREAAPAVVAAPEEAFSGLGNNLGPAGLVVQAKDPQASSPRDAPRTLKDLMNMKAAQKEAQWGEDVEADASDGDQEQSSNDNYFEDLSTGSISSDSAEEPAEFITIGVGKGSTRIYENYFGNFQRPVAEPTSQVPKKGVEDDTGPDSDQAGAASTNAKVQVVGPATDTLAPYVHVTHDFDKLALNNQCAELAEAWQLGLWHSEDVENLGNNTSLTRFPNQSPIPSFEGQKDYHLNLPASPPRLSRGLPSYRLLATSPQKTMPVTSRMKSDPVLRAIQTPKKLQIENEPGVHGGEYAVRPNMQESMVFLRKLFSHQQDASSFPSLLSPPDNPHYTEAHPIVSPTDKSSRGILPRDQHQSRSTIGGKAIVLDSKARVQPGVYALSSQALETGDVHESAHLLNIKDTCTHNASVCAQFGEREKEGVWELLEQMVERRLKEKERSDPFNGWGGKAGGALGIDLVANIMRYYESLGDVQMLATMVCVLSGGRRQQLHLLPTGQDENYDAFIRRYADLLYGWGLLVKRAELMKHLIFNVHQSEGHGQGLVDAGKAPGIALDFTCPKCGKDAEFGTNVCRTCQDFAFKCSICENGVRGLFTVCDACGHGGHVEHIMSWFAEQKDCPSGCGCQCTFLANQPRHQQDVDASNGEPLALGQNPHIPFLGQMEA